MAARIPFFATLIFLGFMGCALYVFVADRYCPIDVDTLTIGGNLHDHKEKAGFNNNEAAQNYKYLAADLPFIFQFIEAAAQQEKRAAELQDQNKKGPRWVTKFFCNAKVGDVAIAFFTWCLVIVGTLQARRLRQTIATMEQTERPFMIFSDHKIIGLTSKPDANGKVRLMLTYGFTNHGRSPAFLRRYNLGIRIDTALLPKPNYGDYTPVRYTVSVGGGFGSGKPTEVLFDAEDIKKLFLGEYEFWVIGSLEYTGTVSLAHKHRYALRMTFDGGDASERFVPDGPDTYWENS